MGSKKVRQQINSIGMWQIGTTVESVCPKSCRLCQSPGEDLQRALPHEQHYTNVAFGRTAVLASSGADTAVRVVNGLAGPANAWTPALGKNWVAIDLGSELWIQTLNIYPGEDSRSQPLPICAWEFKVWTAPTSVWTAPLSAPLATVVAQPSGKTTAYLSLPFFEFSLPFTD